MKRFLLIATVILLVSEGTFGQMRSYSTTGIEIPFSLANINDNGVDQSAILRFAPVLNIETFYNLDMSNNFGIFSGLAVRNVGYIYGHYYDPSREAVYKKKFRSYNVGVPLGIKVGDLDRLFIYGGYEVELATAYKEKTFESGDKTNTTKGWFSDRQNLFQHGFLVGIQFPYGTNIKFKYYLSEFHNQNYTDAQGFKPYGGLKSNVFYFSLNLILFRDLSFYIEE